MADAIVTPYIFDANPVFDAKHRGRLFTVFRHPVDRAVSLFQYLQIADWEPTYDPSLKDMTIAEYAKGERVENNWMTRFLSDSMSGDLNDAHLDAAMDVVRRKFIVGLLSRKEDTMERLERMFRWKFSVNPKNQEICRDNLLTGGANSNSANKKKDKPKPGSEEYDLLAWQNNYDIPLYEYIESLFDEQEELVKDIPVGYRNIDAHCCKCDDPVSCPDVYEKNNK
uniref:Sulfotransferase domain-containing protein n=1 Tax=Proboscia inermis TaxID=420281 RepID=A0A7S0C679_9STRA|mmetsp:Transcript_28915/g.29281  ORF Transcript_28915/g.29281 Transcript_28915/m.29281 type:complete len:225 (+) Transcript_28915:145-819(+)